MATKKKMLQAAAGAAGSEALAIEDVFSTYLYTGDGSNGTSIVNNIDLAGEGGLVWRKKRSSLGTINDHTFFDTERGRTSVLLSNSTAAAVTTTNSIASFNSDGFTVLDNNSYGQNLYEETYASWTFRKAPRFFDVVTYTGDGVAGREIAHNLGQEVGCIVIKRTDSTGNWPIWHRGAGHNGNGFLNSTQDFVSFYVGYFNSTAPTDSVFTVGVNYDVNASGGTYVAYLFAHDPLGPSEDGSDGLIACGSFNTGSSGAFNVNLGWEPQWLMLKLSSAEGGWYIYDNMRGIPTGGSQPPFFTNQSYPETTFPSDDHINLLADGFRVTGNAINQAFGVSKDVVYMAIRRGPMRAPESGTEVFATGGLVTGLVQNPGFVSGFVTDAAIRLYTGGGIDPYMSSRLQGSKYMETANTTAEQTTSSIRWDYMNGWWDAINNNQFFSYMFRRAPAFFDAVCYSGDGTNDRAISHNLTAPPEMAIVKARNQSQQWIVWQKDLGFSGPNYFNLFLNSTTAKDFFPFNYNGSNSISPNPTETTISVGGPYTNNSASQTYIAYLFATLPGVSKVGSYTGNGTSQTIDCGFTTGARFVLIKRTDSTSDWFVLDSARGIVAGNDGLLALNGNGAESTGYDIIDPESSGFIINQTAWNTNVSGASYIFYAIA